MCSTSRKSTFFSPHKYLMKQLLFSHETFSSLSLYSSSIDLRVEYFLDGEECSTSVDLYSWRKCQSSHYISPMGWKKPILLLHIIKTDPPHSPRRAIFSKVLFPIYAYVKKLKISTLTKDTRQLFCTKNDYFFPLQYRRTLFLTVLLFDLQSAFFAYITYLSCTLRNQRFLISADL